MKKIFLLGTVVALTTLNGCDKKLDVAPTQTIDQTVALNASKDVEAALIGAYDALQGASTNTNGDTYAGGYQYTSELLAAVTTEVRFGGTFANLQELFRKELTTINTTAETLWLRSYLAINRANNVLANLDKVTDAKRSRVEGEALFIRGAVYFELVRLYGKQWGDGNNASNPGVPLVLTPTTAVTEANKVPRSTVAEVYAQAIDDLTKAEAALPVANSFYANKSVAAAILARLYLQQGNFAAARDAANRVIASGRYRLVTPFGAAFNTKLNNGGANPAEYVFAIQVNDQDGSNGMNTFFGTTIGSIPGTAGRGDIRIQPAHIAFYEAGDARGAFFIKPSANSANVFTYKFLDRFGNVPVVRLSEMILTRAEANFRLGTTVGAAPLADVNAIRTRAGLPSLTTLTLAAILKERKLELAFEGHAIHDIKRTGGTVGTLPFNSPKLILPVPQRERDIFPLLVQNEGY
ncbi:MAG: RagB/SusD family nutrient uptake outer membrane protein [Cytophagia bacterium]|nr:MAG: RagB/SusD family nutrient uptake outer membrane protein [Runella sp.]TAG20515.1 MAG: RagB/SusD family nutrient uptake outer membrane protein [Cytophagales bacterium]TAG39697.1 MAG: RagB/SusD family nutrient uptake outer membrane protein [Cytophagia bacterium]TAG70298.1 MAG: RagB/SusD family nutrient uptake outer membrane protein [Runella slithyformis]TAG81299.1 MAG: RagB/SusD family nutrient uptake outer membrane protein [Cytophagales bacterium]